VVHVLAVVAQGSRRGFFFAAPLADNADVVVLGAAETYSRSRAAHAVAAPRTLALASGSSGHFNKIT